MKIPWKEPPAALSSWLLIAVTLACLLPFLGKAFHMDDPLFIWTAQHIQSHPIDFYGFNVDWGFKDTPMTIAMLNPPLAAYYMAVVGAILGWSEWALHLGYLIPALALVLGTYHMARRFCVYPFAAALATICCPVFLLSSTSLMCDTMMAAFWVWAVYLWMDGLESKNPRRLLLAATLMAACSLTKYFGACLIPLLAAYSFLQRRRAGPWVLYFLWPFLILGAYQWLTSRLYGHGLLAMSANQAVAQRTATGAVDRIIETLAFAGGCCFIALPTLPLLWRGKGIIAGVMGVGLAGLFLAMMKKIGHFSVVGGGHVNWLFLLQMSFFMLGGAILLALAVADVVRSRSPASILLLLWVAGVLFFVCAINWTVSGRNFLPLAPAAAVLLVRRLEISEADGFGLFWRPLSISLAVALMAAWADWRLAASAREAAVKLTSQLAPRNHDITFEGHWGFQYYMEQLGYQPAKLEPLNLRSNEIILVPLQNTSLFRMPDNIMRTEAEYNFTALPWLTIQNGAAGAGYYCDGWGPIPFLFGPAPPETYQVLRVK